MGVGGVTLDCSQQPEGHLRSLKPFKVILQCIQSFSVTQWQYIHLPKVRSTLLASTRSPISLPCEFSQKANNVPPTCVHICICFVFSHIPTVFLEEKKTEIL